MIYHVSLASYREGRKRRLLLPLPPARRLDGSLGGRPLHGAIRLPPAHREDRPDLPEVETLLCVAFLRGHCVNVCMYVSVIMYECIISTVYVCMC